MCFVVKKAVLDIDQSQTTLQRKDSPPENYRLCSSTGRNRARWACSAASATREASTTAATKPPHQENAVLSKMQLQSAAAHWVEPAQRPGNGPVACCLNGMACIDCGIRSMSALHKLALSSNPTGVNTLFIRTNDIPMSRPSSNKWRVTANETGVSRVSPSLRTMKNS
jgi:hypothetical protein